MLVQANKALTECWAAVPNEALSATQKTIGTQMTPPNIHRALEAELTMY